MASSGCRRRGLRCTTSSATRRSSRRLSECIGAAVRPFAGKPAPTGSDSVSAYTVLVGAGLPAKGRAAAQI
ncbi:MAG: hypothetical protein EOP15_01700 [Pseudomonas sp.]|nr:MAG: hypothetical protein EOP15_01700 [Pseudomonas sp.]